jgi:tetratricopeptide (TPR) repeat protein
MQLNGAIIQANKTKNTSTDIISELHKELIDVLYRLSEVYYYEGQLENAVQIHESNIYLLSAHGTSLEDKARFQIQRGKMLYYQSSLTDSGFGAAWEVLLDANKLAGSSEDKSYMAKVLDLMGLVLYSQAFTNGNFGKPREYFRQAFELSQQLVDTRGMSESLFHIGLTYQNKDNRTEEDREEALKHFHEAEELVKTGGHKLEESYIVRHIAADHQENGNLDKALVGFERSLELREQIRYKVYQPAALLAIGQVFRDRHELDQAIANYQRAYILAEQMNQTVYVVRSQIAMGDAEKENMNITQAQKHYETALRAAESIKYKNGIEVAADKIESINQA